MRDTMSTSTSSGGMIPENRILTVEELTLIEWLLAHGKPEAKKYAEQVHSLRVVSRCSCGCATVDLVVGSDQAATTGPSEILSDFEGETPEGAHVGVILHARQGKISELEIYPLPDDTGSLPKIDSLKILNFPPGWER